MFSRTEPPLVQKARRLARQASFERSSRPELGPLLRTFAAAAGPGAVAEAGSGYGVGTAWLESGLAPGARLYTVEPDPARAQAVKFLMAERPAVTVLIDDWHGALAPLAPLDLLFLDGGGWKRNAARELDFARRLLRPGGFLLIDDMSPDCTGPDPVRDHLERSSAFTAAELLIAPDAAVIVAVCTGTDGADRSPSRCASDGRCEEPSVLPT